MCAVMLRQIIVKLESTCLNELHSANKTPKPSLHTENCMLGSGGTVGDVILFGFVTISVREYFCTIDALRGQRLKPWLLVKLLAVYILEPAAARVCICCDVCGWNIQHGVAS